MQSPLALLRLPARQLIGLTIAVASVIALTIGAWTWSQTPDYRVLFSNLEDKDGGSVVSALSQMNIPYKYSDGGGAILVPSNLVYDTRLRLASQGLPRGGTTGFELMEQQRFGTTQFQEQVNYQRGLEGELARTIQSISSVQGARVHLAIPKSSVFLRDQQKPSASVLVNLYPGKRLDRAQVNGILHLVSSSVPELAANNVSIVDQTGSLLTNQAAADGLDPAQLAYVQELEQNYSRRILAIIEPITGRDNVRAQVTADVDFSQTEQTDETYHPNGVPEKSAIRSQQSSEGTTNSSTGSQSPAGVPGAASNQPQSTSGATPATPATAAGAAAAANSNTASHKENTVNYELDKTVQLKRLAAGALKRLSVAIVVNNRRVVDDKGVATYTALPKEQVDQLTALAREAVGFTEARGDSLNVVNATFNEQVLEPVTETPIWKDPDNIATAKEFGKNLLIGAFILYLVFGVLRPMIRNLLAQAPRHETELVSLDQDENPALGRNSPGMRSLESAKQLAQTDPRLVANVVKGWVSTNE
jgi:flagellar M-ring protein FliF